MVRLSELSTLLLCLGKWFLSGNVYVSSSVKWLGKCVMCLWRINETARAEQWTPSQPTHLNVLHTFKSDYSIVFVPAGTSLCPIPISHIVLLLYLSKCFWLLCLTVEFWLCFGDLSRSALISQGILEKIWGQDLGLSNLSSNLPSVFWNCTSALYLT
jgi:hypothetical protein